MTEKIPAKKRATKWTDEKVKALRLPEGKDLARTRVEPGLYMVLRRLTDGSISRHWHYRVQVDGARRWLSLGSYPEMSLRQADEKRFNHDTVLDSARKGEADHPAIAERQARKARKAQPSVAELFADWVADKRMGSARKGGEPVRERTIKLLTDNFDADIRNRIGDSKVAKITRQALQDCIDAPRKRGAPGAASHVYRTLRGLMNFALKRGFVDGADPMRGIENPRPYRPAPVNAANDTEIAALLKQVDVSALWPATKLAIEFQLLTGARPGEVRLATWAEVDAERARWTIPAGRVKSGRDFRVHLSKQALAVLEQAKLLRGLNKTNEGVRNDYVFPGANGGAMEKMAVARALSRHAQRITEAGGKKLRPHDLRRTFRTMLSRIGVAPHIAELCMNHVERNQMARVYDGHDYSAEMNDAWDRAGAHLQALRAGGAVVIPLAGRRA